MKPCKTVYMDNVKYAFVNKKGFYVSSGESSYLIEVIDFKVVNYLNSKTYKTTKMYAYDLSFGVSKHTKVHLTLRPDENLYYLGEV